MHPIDIETEKPQMLPLVEVAKLLVKHFGYHDGLYEVSIGLSIGVGPTGPAPDVKFPGVAVAISEIGLTKARQPGPHVVNAAEVNPLLPPEKTKPTGKPAAARKPRKAPM